MSSGIIYTRKEREQKRREKRAERRRLKRAVVHLADAGKQMA